MNFGKYAPALGKGIIGTFAPNILKGALVEFFRERKIGTRELTEWVEKDSNLWDSFGPEHQRQLRQLASKAGKLDFLTAQWVIDALRGDFPAVASLFLGWTKGANWLKRQVVIIKNKL